MTLRFSREAKRLYFFYRTLFLAPVACTQPLYDGTTTALLWRAGSAGIRPDPGGAAERGPGPGRLRADPSLGLMRFAFL